MRAFNSLSAAAIFLVGLTYVSPGVAHAKAEPMDQLARETEWWLSGLGVSAAQGPAHGGAGVKVCLDDSGVDASHPDLKGAHFAGGHDFSGEGSPDGLKPLSHSEIPDHGTAMAAWIVGQGHGPGHSKGILGVAPKATLMSMSANYGAAPNGSVVRYCVDHGASVVNLSMAWEPSASDIAYALAHNAVVVSSAGNRDALNGRRVCVGGMGGLQLGQLTVGGVTEEHKIDPASCQQSDVASGREYTTQHSPAMISVGAPSGGGMKSSIEAFPLVMAEPNGPNGPYHIYGGGTSTSAALTSGVVALVRAAHPELKAGDVINRLIRTATPVSGGGASGPKGPMGFGIINAKAAVSADVPSVGGANPLGDPATGDGGVWTNPSWNGGSSSAGGSSQADGAFSAQGSSGGSVGTLLWVVGGVAALGVVVIGGVVAASRRKRP